MVDRLTGDIQDMIELSELNDPSLSEQIQFETQRIQSELDRLSAQNADPTDKLPAYVTIIAGSGGREACSWAEMLLRMYSKYLYKYNLSAEFIDFVPNEPDGIKTVTLRVFGDGAFGRFKNESGVHRLSRVSPFDQADRRQTSFAAVEVTAEIEKVEQDIMQEKDLDIWTCCGGGKGGQNVNKRETVVMIHHLPTGLRVRCQNERTQEANRKIALQVMLSKIIKLKEYEARQEATEIHSKRPKAAFGNEYRRTYVLSQHPQIVDHATDKKTMNTAAVLDGDLEELA